MPDPSTRSPRTACAVIAAVICMAAALTAVASVAVPARAAPESSAACSTSITAERFSDALDKSTDDGIPVGGLSSIAWDPSTKAYATVIDNHGGDLARIFHVTNAATPAFVDPPIVLRNAQGVAYDGRSSDNEGLAVLPDGRYAVSSETEPSIRIYDRTGLEQQSLTIPDAFRVAPTGRGVFNATLEGLTVSPSGRFLVAAMEQPLLGDGGNLTRLLIYRNTGNGWALDRQVAYPLTPGMRVPEVSALSDDTLLLLEARYDRTAGNTVVVNRVDGLQSVPDISATSTLTAATPSLHKTELADLTHCPTLGAAAKQPQANPLMDNYEGMSARPLGADRFAVNLISDDNFAPNQVTRVLDLDAQLPHVQLAPGAAHPGDPILVTGVGFTPSANYTIALGDTSTIAQANPDGRISVTAAAPQRTATLTATDDAGTEVLLTPPTLTVDVPADTPAPTAPDVAAPQVPPLQSMPPHLPVVSG